MIDRTKNVYRFRVLVAKSWRILIEKKLQFMNDKLKLITMLENKHFTEGYVIFDTFFT